ncbi:MarR family winged helix-turn-helix transcriptional regulator [Stappia sp.]|jgi:DNA-binding MarR family transcriptional regulator|uniref:MarR family winged helix-turn-helix transcriptional regulator n=1 Tax=Stappia sp. TaxID=1870903 RepID=UPI003A99B919
MEQDRDETPGFGDADEPLRLSRQLCFALNSATLALGRVYQGVLAPLGLTYTQYLVMLVLWERGETSVKGLGEALFLDSGTLTPLLKRLEAAGLVLRRRDTADERRVLVSVSEEGARLKLQARGVPERIASACMASGVDLARFKEDLEALRAALNTTQANGPRAVP